MRLVVLGSSSAGNGYLLDNGHECLILECGIPFQEALRAIGFDARRIVGCLISHEHGDHARHAQRYIDNQIPVFCSLGTAISLDINACRMAHILTTANGANIGGFRVRPFPTQHDAAEPFGFLIHHKECGTIMFATDTYYLRNRFRGLNNILVECNYRSDILERNVNRGALSPVQRDRTLQSHMEYNTCLEMLLANDLSAVSNIVLLHLSDGNSNADEFQQGIANATGRRVYVANTGLIIDPFNKTPF